MSRSALGLQAALRQTASKAAMGRRRGIRFPLALDDLAEGLQGRDRIRPGPRGLGGLRGDGVANIEEHLEEKLFALESGIQIRHAVLSLSGSSTGVAFPVNWVPVRVHA